MDKNTETQTIYSSDTSRVIADKDEKIVCSEYLDLEPGYVLPKGADVGIVEYCVERKIDGEWLTEAIFAAPIYDPTLRSAAATAALKAAE